MARTNVWRVYINPFDDSGNYAGYREVTADVDFSSLGMISQDLDNTDYNIGVYRTNNISVAFRNDKGLYSDVGSPTSMFRYTRADSLLRITWATESNMKAGFIKAGQTNLSVETEVFVGLINDDSLSMDLDTQEVQFTVLGRESRFNKTIVPINSVTQPGGAIAFSIASPCVATTTSPHGLVAGNPVSFTTTGALAHDLVSSTPYYVVTTPSSTTFTFSTALAGSEVDTSGTQSGTHSLTLLFGKTISSVILACLNLPAITEVLAVNSMNINVGTDCALDSVVDLQNKTTQQALADLLLISNSVLYVENGAVIVAPRVASSTVNYTFYGQSSTAGPENIITIKKIRSGLNRVFNHLYWSPSSVLKDDQSSVDKYGARSKEFKQSYITDPTKQRTVLGNILNEFRLPKQEFELYTPLDYPLLPVGLLSRISMDYPPMYLPGNSSLPICGAAVCGSAVLPDAIWSFSLRPDEHLKVIGRAVDQQKSLLVYKMRLI